MSGPLETLIVMFAHPDVWIETSDKSVICEFPPRYGDESIQHFEDRKMLAEQVKVALLFKPPQVGHGAVGDLSPK